METSITETKMGAPRGATGYLRLPKILELIPVGKSTWWAGVKSGRYPKPVKLSPNCTAWRAEDIYELMLQISKATPGEKAVAWKV
ncbi:MAG: AlpA family phage regulatory protein [Verrucomicrobiia bacterium]